MSKILLLHAWFATPQDHWYPGTKKILEGYKHTVVIPQLEDKDKPTIESWKASAFKDFTITQETSIIGHSLGSVLALKIAQEATTPFDTLVLVSGWDYWDLTPEHKSFFETPVDHKAIIANTMRRIVIHSDNDPYVTEFISKEFAQRLQAEHILIKGGGHFTTDDGTTHIQELEKIFNPA